jgi:Putative lumazine-binding
MITIFTGILKTRKPMKKVHLTLVALLVACNCLLAQSNEENAVKLPIQQLFEAMKKSDSTMLTQMMAPGARLETVIKSKSGDISVKSDPISQFVAAVGKAPIGALDERLSSMEIKVDAELATAWTPYEFYYNGKFSHCGVNAFQLVKLNGSWKILSIIDTRRREGCVGVK